MLKQRLTAYVFTLLLPALLVVLVFFIAPLVHKFDIKALTIVAVLLGVLNLANHLGYFVLVQSWLSQAKKNREAFLAGFKQWHRSALLFSMLHTLVGGLLLSLPIVAVLSLAISEVITPTLGLNRKVIPALIGLLPIVLFFLWRSMVLRLTREWALLHPCDKESMEYMRGFLVTRKKHPLLWQWVEQTALKLQAPVPDNIVISLQVSFFITESPINLNNNMVLRGKTLHLSLPFLMYLEQDEATCVLGHELSHFASEDGSFGLKVNPIYEQIIDLIDSIFASTKNSPSWFRLVKHYGFSSSDSLIYHDFLRFFKVQQFWSREREVAADALGISVSSKEAFATSLLRTITLEDPIHELLDSIWQQAGAFDGDLILEIERSILQAKLNDPNEYLSLQHHHPFDTHPTISERFQAQNVALDTEVLARSIEKKRTDLLYRLEILTPVSEPLQPIEDETMVSAKKVDVADVLEDDFLASAYYSKKADEQSFLQMVERAKYHYDLITQKTSILWILKVSGLMLLWLIVGFGAFYFYLTYSNAILVIAVAAPLFVLILLCFLYMNKHKVRRLIRAQFAEIQPKGIRLSYLPRLIEWEHIKEYKVSLRSEGLGALGIRLYLEDEYSLTDEQKKWAGKNYHAKTHCLSLFTSLLLENYNDTDVAEIMQTYWQAKIARKILAEHFQD